MRSAFAQATADSLREKAGRRLVSRVGIVSKRRGRRPKHGYVRNTRSRPLVSTSPHDSADKAPVCDRFRWEYQREMTVWEEERRDAPTPLLAGRDAFTRQH